MTQFRVFRGALAAIAVVAILPATLPANAETLIVGNKAEDTVSFIDLGSGEEFARTATGPAPHEIAVSPDGRTAVVVSYRAQGYVGHSLHLFDVATGTKTSEIDLGEHRAPHGLKWIPGTDRVVVTTEETRDIAIVDIALGEVVGRVATGKDGTHMAALSPDGTTAYVANMGAGSFSVIALNTLELVKTVKAGKVTEAIAVTPDGKFIWAGNNGSRNIMVFDAQSFKRTRTIKTDGVPIRVEISPDGKIAAVSHFDRDEVVAFSTVTGEEIARVAFGEGGVKVPVTMMFAPDGARLWVAATGTAQIIEIDTGDWSVARVLAAGKGSDGLALSPVDRDITISR